MLYIYKCQAGTLARSKKMTKVLKTFRNFNGDSVTFKRKDGIYIVRTRLNGSVFENREFDNYDEAFKAFRFTKNWLN